MRKSSILLVTMLLLSMPMQSQIFLTQEDLDAAREAEWQDLGLIIPMHEVDLDQAEPFVPVGSGIALLAALGGAYLLGKRKKD